MRYAKIISTSFVLALSLPALAADIPVTLYRNPNCGCCDLWAKHLEADGFKVTRVDTFDMASVQGRYGVPERLAGCHTATVGGYVVEGLVPASLIKRLLSEHRPVKGIALPGMPIGAPGMPGDKRGPLDVYYLGNQTTPAVFTTFSARWP